MRDPFTPGGCVEPRTATHAGKEKTKFGNPNNMLPHITVSTFWESFTTGKNGVRTGWPLEQLRLRFACPTAPPVPAGSQKHRALPQGGKQQRIVCIVSFRGLFQNMASPSSCRSPSDTAKISSIHL